MVSLSSSGLMWADIIVYISTATAACPSVRRRWRWIARMKGTQSGSEKRPPRLVDWSSKYRSQHDWFLHLNGSVNALLCIISLGNIWRRSFFHSMKLFSSCIMFALIVVYFVLPEANWRIHRCEWRRKRSNEVVESSRYEEWVKKIHSYCLSSLC